MLAAPVLLLLLAVAAVEIARVIVALRRAVRLNRALHELRRPLQSISLSIEGSHPDLSCAGACLEQARGALEELDAAVNRRGLCRATVRTPLAALASSLEDRWRFAGVRVSAPIGGRELDADPLALGAALDNLVANAVEHGRGPVSVRALSSAGAVRFEVRDEGTGAAPAPRPAADGLRRGHGLSVAAAHAASHGGTLIAPAPLPGGGTVAALSLPAPPAGPSRGTG